MAFALNTLAVVGRLGRDPELRHTPSGVAVCSLRIAVDGAGEKVGDEYKPGWFDVTVWGDQGENCARYLAKGKQVGIAGRLHYREWEAQDGTKRNAVGITATTVQFLGSKDDEAGGFEPVQQAAPPASSAPAAAADPFVVVRGSDDDIPF